MKHAREDCNRIQDPAYLIPEDEPVFLIRAKDVSGPDVLQFWIQASIRAGVKPDMIELAQIHWERMVAWQKQHGCKVPDLPEENNA